jgi:hypothetical protein
MPITLIIRPGKSPFLAVGEETIRVAAGALPGHKYGRFLQPRREQLPPVRLRQIQVHAGPDFAMPRRAGGEKQHRIFLPDRVGVVHLAEEFRRIG